MTTPTPSVPDSAEQIAEKVIELLAVWKGKPAEHQMAVANIAQALTAFGRAQYERGVNESDKKIIEAYQTGLRRGTVDAIEKAAGVAEEHDAGIKRLVEMGIQGDIVPLAVKLRSLLPKEGAK